MSSMWSVFAYSIWSPIQYVKQLYVTPAWNSNSSAATIKLDGANGRLDAKTIYENGDKVATESNLENTANSTLSNAKNYARQQANRALTQAMQYINTHASGGNRITSLCGKNHIWWHNKLGMTCQKKIITDYGRCKDAFQKNFEWTMSERAVHKWEVRNIGSIRDFNRKFKCHAGFVEVQGRGYNNSVWRAKVATVWTTPVYKFIR